MEGKPTGNGCVGIRKATYLSQYESHESESQSRIRLSRSSKVMRKLKQLWDRQKYLTDDELESGLDQRDLSKYQESSPSKHIGCTNNWQQGCDNSQVCKRLHSRAVSQGEEHMNVLRKITDQGETHRDTVKSKALAQIAALGSQAEKSG